MNRLIIVSNRLPITVGKTIRKSSGGLVSALEGIKDQLDMKWIGWPGTTSQNSHKKQELEKRLTKDHHCHPVFMTKKEVDSFYHGFSNSSLWPLLHYRPDYVRHESHWWDEYKAINQRFADVILKNTKRNDTIWIQDYHLMLLPSLLRKKRKNLKIGFFLHTPFPSYEVFRYHPRRKELLKGMLGADLIGFHTFGYMRHFRSSVNRLLGIESDPDSIPYLNRSCHIGVYPIGADAQAFLNEMSTKRYKQRRAQYKKTYQDKKIVLSVERLDYTKGLLRRLDAIDKFLSEWPDINNIIFIFLCIPTRDEVPEYQQLREEVETKIGHINGKYATVENIPIHFMHKTLSFTGLCALYSLADVAMITPLIDGMNLVAKEYVICQQEKKGSLILSEFAGAAGELFNAFNINPYDVEKMADCLRLALTVDQKDKDRRMHGMFKRVVKYDASYWAHSFLTDLDRPSEEKTIPVEATDIKLEIVKRLQKASQMAWFLDYDGTLSDFYDNPDDAYPSKSLQKQFQQLEALNNVDVFIISGRKADDLQKWFKESNFTLIAEHGLKYRSPYNKKWHDLITNVDFTWKQTVLEIFDKYAGTTPGSFIEEKTSSIVWHYRRSDPEFGRLKAMQLINILQELLSNFPVEVHHGKKIVEVSSIQVNKGVALSEFIQQTDYDLIICAGDDRTDENMFKVNNKNLLSIKIGSGESNADYRVASPDKFRRLLAHLLKTMNSKQIGT